MRARVRQLHNALPAPIRTWLGIALACGLLMLPLTAGLWLAQRSQSTRASTTFNTHQEQVGAALRQHGIAFTHVYLDRGWPDRINSQNFGANLAIYLDDTPDAKAVPGRLECRIAKRKCWFQVARLGLEREELSDLVPFSSAAPVTSTRDTTMIGRLRTLNSCFAGTPSPVLTPFVGRTGSTSSRSIKSGVSEFSDCLTSLTSHRQVPRIERP
jgi:hypothetical protein